MPKNILNGSSRCITCGNRGGLFITPNGLMCRRHALNEAIDHEAHSGENWIPPLVKQPDSAPIRSKSGTRTG